MSKSRSGCSLECRRLPIDDVPLQLDEHDEQVKSEDEELSSELLKMAPSLRPFLKYIYAFS